MKKAIIFLISLLAGMYFFTSPAPKFEVASAVETHHRSEEESLTIEIYKRYSPAVVYISTVSLTIDPFDFFSQYQQQKGNGSGVIIDAKNGIILTNLHVIENANKIEIVLSDGKSYQAKYLGADYENDIAVLKLKEIPQNLIQIPIGDSEKLEVGQRVLAIGNPFGLNSTLTTGIVSSLNRSVNDSNNNLMKGMIQTDAAINPGNSGGPLMDGQGYLIGINTAILSQSGDSAGIGFATPINPIMKVLPELISTGKVKRPVMGWILVDTNAGVLVRRVSPDGPATKAGIVPLEYQTGRGYVRDFSQAEFIMSVNGEKVKTADDVNELVKANGAEKEIEFELANSSRQKRIVKIKPVLQ